MPGTPFSPPPAPPSTSKKSAPISSNAFGFSFASGTPSKPLVSTGKRTPRQSTPLPLKAGAATARERASRPGPSEASSSSRTPHVRLSETPLRSVKREEENSSTPRRATFRLNDLSNPFIPPSQPKIPETTKGKRKLNEVLNQDSPFRAHPPPPNPHEGKELRGVSDLREGVNVDNILDSSEVTRVKVEQEEGVGVSPRRIKGISNWGKAPSSLSKQLSDLLSAQTSAILLFYTSLQHSLTPARPLPLARSGRPPFPQPNLPIPAVKTEGLPSLLSHTRPAPLRLRLTRPIRGRTQYAHLWLCEVLKWPDPVPRTDYLGKVIQDDREAPEEVVCVFQSLPSDCPRIGLDPRLLASRLEAGMSGNQDKIWEVGVWSPWSDVDMVTDIILPSRMTLQVKEDEHPGVASQDWPEEEEDGEDMERQIANGTEADKQTVQQDHNPIGEKRITKVLFASRYLITER